MGLAEQNVAKVLKNPVPANLFLIYIKKKAAKAQQNLPKLARTGAWH